MGQPDEIIIEQNVTRVTYDNTIPNHRLQPKCTITQYDFVNGDVVAQLPCGHLFDCDHITRWLQMWVSHQEDPRFRIYPRGCPNCRARVPAGDSASAASSSKPDPRQRGEGGEQEPGLFAPALA